MIQQHLNVQRALVRFQYDHRGMWKTAFSILVALLKHASLPNNKPRTSDMRCVCVIIDCKKDIYAKEA